MSNPVTQPWDAPALERAGLPSAFGWLPEDLTRLGAPGRPELLFSRLQRPWTWTPDGPALGKAAMAWLRGVADAALPELLETHPSEDGSTKVVLRLADGERIEAVHMPREVRSPRVTLCISSQVGCAMGCTFCATGAMGIRRNLAAGEIVGQVLALIRALGPAQSHSVTLVFMGMGEPLHNLDNVHRAIRILNHPAGLNISTRRITVSTSGLVPGIERLSAMRPRPWLALSLNATTDEARSRVMPVNRVWNLARLRPGPVDPGARRKAAGGVRAHGRGERHPGGCRSARRLVGRSAPGAQHQPDPHERTPFVPVPAAGRDPPPGLPGASQGAGLLRHRAQEPGSGRAGGLRPAAQMIRAEGKKIFIYVCGPGVWPHNTDCANF
jgi:23S rRNA (adenine2503-C2)-methyltransferase